MRALAAVSAIALCGCSAAGSGSQPIELAAPAVATPESPGAEQPPPRPSPNGPVFLSALHVSPDEALEPFMQSVTDRYSRLGFNVAVSDDGIPMFLSSALPEGSQARAYYERWCFAEGCSPESTYVKVSPALLERPEAFIINSLLHELGHIISGWGGCAEHLPMADGMHLARGNLISNGNEDYADLDFTEDDLRLLVSCLETE